MNVPKPARASVMKMLLPMRSGSLPMVSTKRPEVMEANNWTNPTMTAAPCGFIPPKLARKIGT